VEELLSQKQAARLLGLSVRTLERHRLAGTGPQHCKIGRLVRYRPCDIEAWLLKSIQQSTVKIELK
jgi:predicted DNA-binding transcriptional regulator AlpA